MDAKDIVIGKIYRIRQWEDMVKEHRTGTHGNIDADTNCFFHKHMAYLCGKEYTPKEILPNGELEPEVDDWCIEPWMLEPLPAAKPVGMYGETPRVQVGKFSICRQDDNSVWIQKDGGEGGQFPDSAFEEAIENFYNERF